MLLVTVAISCTVYVLPPFIVPPLILPNTLLKSERLKSVCPGTSQMYWNTECVFNMQRRESRPLVHKSINKDTPKRWQNYFQELMTQISTETIVGARPAISHAFRVRLRHLPSLIRDTYLRLLPYFQNIFALNTPNLYMLSLSKNCPNLNFHCQSHSIALLPGWQVWSWILPSLPACSSLIALLPSNLFCLFCCYHKQQNISCTSTSMTADDGFLANRRLTVLRDIDTK